MSAPLCAAFDPNPRAQSFEVPALACDTHAHVCGPESRYPYLEERVYTPPDAPLEAYRRMLDTFGVARAVIVQPSIYGADNRLMLDTLARDPARLRGIAVVLFDVSDAELDRLHALGVRGVRSNIVDLKTGKGQLPLAELRALASRVKRLGWHLEFLMHVDEFPDLDRQLADFPVEVSFGHLGYVPCAKGTETPGFRALVRLMKDGRAWAKLTGPYRLTPSGLPYDGVDAFAQVLVSEAPSRLLWGSDWPHVAIKTPMPNDGDLFDLFARWVPDAALRRRILVEHPAKLYDFPG